MLTVQGLSASQSFIIDNAKIPFDNVTTSDVELGDVDLDGDWDVVLGNGDEDSGFQNALWINQGGAQAIEEGLFLDETTTRLPQSQDTTVDACLGDIDADGDLDLHLSNSAYLFPWTSRWWINTGGKQGSAVGYYVDETSSRWVGLGQPGSSVPSTVLKDGSFLDDCRDSELADLDNDGDLDLIHSTYWHGPDYPARIFLNDGDGHYQEFNPSGGTILGGVLPPGFPGLWCDGIYDNLTSDTTGAFCDPTMVSSDADAGDIDGDFDLDIIFSDDWYDPGVFANRLEGSALAPAVGGGTLGFRDVWGTVLAPGFCGNEDNCQELGDLDGDGDLDLAGGDYSGTLSTMDTVFEWKGGAFVLRIILSSIGQKLSVECFDYDQDGDLDLLSVGDKVQLHSNQGAFAFTEVAMPVGVPKAWRDADVADLDGDGDLDVLLGTVVGGEDLFVNQIDLPDTHAPYVPHMEGVEDRMASPSPIPVRAHVYDNAPHYVTAHNPTHLVVAVDGVALPAVTARCSRGQIFRAQLPGNLVGQISYRFVSQDEAGNLGASAQMAYSSSTPGIFQVAYGIATSGLTGGSPVLRALSVPFAGSTLYLAVSSNAAEGTPAVIGIGSQPLNPGVHLPGLLLLQIAGQVLAVAPKNLDGVGNAVISAPLGAVPPGLTAYAQGFVLDTTAGGEVFASSKGLAITTQ